MKYFLSLGILLLSLSTLFAAGSTEEAFELGNGTEPETLDLHLMSGVPEHRLAMGLFEGLVNIDPETALPIPGVAESWDVSSDGRTYTFYLRQTQWSDGEPITAYDFVNSWIRMVDPETAAPYAWFPVEFIEGAEAFNAGNAGPEAVQVRALDDYTFQFQTKGPFPYVVKALTHYSFGVVPIHAVEKFGDDWTLPQNIVTNGPYTLEEWTPQERIVMVPNPNYWDSSKAELERVVFYPVESDSTMFSMYRNEEIDWATNVPTEQIDTAKAWDDFHINAYLGTYYYVFQTQKPPFDDSRVRRALSLSINRNELVGEITKAGQQPAEGFVPPMAGYQGVAGLGEDVEEAQRLLAEAGFPDGEGFPVVEVLYNTNEAHKSIAEYIQQQWKENLNIDVALVNQEWSTYLASRRSGDFQIARAGWIGDYNDPNTFLSLFQTEAAKMGGSRFDNAQYNQLLERASQISDDVERLAVLREAEELLIAEHPVMPIYYYVTMNLIDINQWDGWYQNIMDYHPVGAIAGN